MKTCAHPNNDCVKPQHTPTPWKIEESYVGARYMVRSAHGDETAMTRYREDAAFIVRAVNCHEELVEALKGAVRAIEYLSGTTKHGLIYEAAKQAIAKAEGL